MTLRILRALAALLLVAAAGACARRAPLDVLLAGLEGAIEARDADAVARHLAPEMTTANGMSGKMAISELKRYFLAYKSLDVSLSEIAPEGDPLRKVTVRVDVSGQARQFGGVAGMLPDVAAYRFELDLVAKDGKLLVSGASWQRLDRAGP